MPDFVISEESITMIKVSCSISNELTLTINRPNLFSQWQWLYISFSLVISTPLHFWIRGVMISWVGIICCLHLYKYKFDRWDQISSSAKYHSSSFHIGPYLLIRLPLSTLIPIPLPSLPFPLSHQYEESYSYGNNNVTSNG